MCCLVHGVLHERLLLVGPYLRFSSIVWRLPSPDRIAGLGKQCGALGGGTRKRWFRHERAMPMMEIDENAVGPSK